MKRILCFGDSNTWGYDPETFFRYPEEVRWTGRLQAAHPDWRIVECGLNGRTTAFPDPLEPGRSGLEYLPVALKTHDPLDLVVLMLGTNDAKRRMHVQAEEIALGMERLILTVQATALWGGKSQPQVLVVAPPPMDADGLADSPMADAFDLDSVRKTQRLASCYQALCSRLGAAFFDARTAVAHMGPVDGTHMTAADHAALAQALGAQLEQLL